MLSKLKSNQKGAIPITLLVVIVIAIIGAGAYYFFSKQNDKDSSAKTSTAESSAINSACKAYINDDDYCKFASNWSAEESMTMVIKTEDGSVMTLKTNGDDSHSVFEKDGSVMSETITLGNALYMKNDDDTWTKMDSQIDGGSFTADDFSPDFEFDSEVNNENTEQIKKLGKEACGDLTCFKYQILDSSDPESETLLWFDDKDYKIRRMSTKSPDGTSEIAYSYGQVTISEPSPVVEMPDYENMSIEELQRQFGQ